LITTAPPAFPLVDGSARGSPLAPRGCHSSRMPVQRKCGTKVHSTKLQHPQNIVFHLKNDFANSTLSIKWLLSLRHYKSGGYKALHFSYSVKAWCVFPLNATPIYKYKYISCLYCSVSGTSPANAPQCFSAHCKPQADEADLCGRGGSTCFILFCISCITSQQLQRVELVELLLVLRGGRSGLGLSILHPKGDTGFLHASGGQARAEEARRHKRRMSGHLT